MKKIKQILREWWSPIPVYVTRETPGRKVGTFDVAAIWIVIGLHLAAANVLLWGIVGIVAAIRILF
jgi:hypothetical protein